MSILYVIIVVILEQLCVVQSIEKHFEIVDMQGNMTPKVIRKVKKLIEGSHIGGQRRSWGVPEKILETRLLNKRSRAGKRIVNGFEMGPGIVRLVVFSIFIATISSNVFGCNTFSVIVFYQFHKRYIIVLCVLKMHSGIVLKQTDLTKSAPRPYRSIVIEMLTFFFYGIFMIIGLFTMMVFA